MESSPRRQSSRRAFTLIELLVVVSVIALLIAILLPALASAKRVAAEAECAAANRSLGQISLAYAIDDKDRLPRMHTRLDLTTPITDLGFTNPYWIFVEWREVFEEYGAVRENFYYSRNDYWNRDDFYYRSTGDPQTAGAAVIGRMYLAGDWVNDDTEFRAGFDTGLSPLADALAQDPGAQYFARKQGDAAVFDVMWADLTRDFGGTGTFINYNLEGVIVPGANHLSKDDFSVHGTHVTRQDGSTEYRPESEMEARVFYASSRMYW